LLQWSIFAEEAVFFASVRKFVSPTFTFLIPYPALASVYITTFRTPVVIFPTFHLFEPFAFTAKTLIVFGFLLSFFTLTYTRFSAVWPLRVKQIYLGHLPAEFNFGKLNQTFYS